MVVTSVGTFLLEAKTQEVILRILLFLVPQISQINTDFWTCAVLGKVTQIAQRTQISSLLFYVPQIARITQIYVLFGRGPPVEVYN